MISETDIAMFYVLSMLRDALRMWDSQAMYGLRWMKLLGMQKMVASFFFRRTHLAAIPDSRPEWRSDSRM